MNTLSPRMKQVLGISDELKADGQQCITDDCGGEATYPVIREDGNVARHPETSVQVFHCRHCHAINTRKFADFDAASDHVFDVIEEWQTLVIAEIREWNSHEKSFVVQTINEFNEAVSETDESGRARSHRIAAICHKEERGIVTDHQGYEPRSLTF